MKITDRTFDQYYDALCITVWERWTKNGLGMDADEREQTQKSVNDAVTNTYVDGIDQAEWQAEALKRLGN